MKKKSQNSCITIIYLLYYKYRGEIPRNPKKQMTKQITFNQYMKLQTPEAIQTRENWKAIQTNRGWTNEYTESLMKVAFKELRKGGLV